MNRYLQTGFALMVFSMAGCVSASIGGPLAPGPQTNIERQHNVDLIGDFSPIELDTIELVLERTTQLAPQAFSRGRIVIEKVDSLANPDAGGTSQLQSEHRLFDQKVELIQMLDMDALHSTTTKQILNSYQAMVSHEIGHILLLRRDTSKVGWPMLRDSLGYQTFNDEWSALAYNEAKELRAKFRELKNLTDSLEVNFEQPRQFGYVSNYAARDRLLRESMVQARPEMDLMEATKDSIQREIDERYQEIDALRDSVNLYKGRVSRGEGFHDYETFLRGWGGNVVLMVSANRLVRILTDARVENRPLTGVERDNVLLESDELLKGVESLRSMVQLQEAMLQMTHMTASVIMMAIGAELILKDPVNEDQAETFAYLLTGEHYADDDPIVRQKVAAVRAFLERVYRH